jgi:hypothetical protein
MEYRFFFLFLKTLKLITGFLKVVEQAQSSPTNHTPLLKIVSGQTF